jgi:alpha-ribazole phosphatase
MKLTLIRHTSVDVPKGICYGITDVPLASTFRNEMEQVGKNLGAADFDAAFTSPLSRCKKLAAQILPDKHILIDDRLTELDFGNWEMEPWNVIFDSQDGKKWFTDYVNVRCPGGESFTDLIQRGKSFLEDLQDTKYGRVVIFTHAGIIRAMTCLLQDKTPEEAFSTPFEYGQIITFNLENE